MDKILIEIDVVLDFLFDRHPFAHHDARVLSLCEFRLIKGYSTPVICSNIYYLLRRTASHKEVIGKLTQLLEIIDILQMNGEIVRNALKSGFPDFEDALQNFAAV